MAAIPLIVLAIINATLALFHTQTFTTTTSGFLDYPGVTGMQRLWIPYKTMDGTPEAALITQLTSSTVYHIHCPITELSCPIPDLTITEGRSTLQYTDNGGTTVGCTIIDPSYAICSRDMVPNAPPLRTAQHFHGEDIAWKDVPVVQREPTTEDTVTNGGWAGQQWVFAIGLWVLVLALPLLL